MKKGINKRNKLNKLPLSEVICCVETFNSDGVDSSQRNIKILQVEISLLFVFYSFLIYYLLFMIGFRCKS